MDEPTEQRIDRIDVNLRLLIQEVRTSNRQQELMARTLYGPMGTTGLVRAVDRLDQAEKRRVWHLRTLWGAIVSLAGTYASGLFTGK